MMSNMNIRDEYKLILIWDTIKYDGGIAYLSEARFLGPVLKNAKKIFPNDSISLDFTRQNSTNNIFLPDNYYIAKLRWKEVTYKEDYIELGECTLDHYRTGSLKDLSLGTQIFIDCSRHEERIHYRHLVYPSWVVNKNGEELN